MSTLAAATTKTLLAINPATGFIIRPVAWGISFNAAVAAVPGVAELVETNIAPTVTAYAVADVQPYADANAPAGWTEWDTHQAHVAVPAGPISHW